MASEMMEAPGTSTPFPLESILVDLEEALYISLILPTSLINLVAGRRSADGDTARGGSSGGYRKPTPKVGATERLAQVRARYEAHLPSLSLWDGENSGSILVGAVLPTLHVHVLCKNWHLCGV